MTSSSDAVLAGAALQATASSRHRSRRTASSSPQGSTLGFDDGSAAATGAGNAAVAPMPERRNVDWEIDWQAQLERSERRAWRVALGCLIVAVLALGAVMAQGALRQVVPLPVVVDRHTGEVTVEQRLSVETVPLNEAVDKHNVARFVRARQAYVWNFLQQDYNAVARMSTPEVFEPYGRQFEGKDGLDQRWKATQEHRVHIVNVRLTQPAAAGRPGEAVVTYDKESLYLDHSASDVTTRHVATVRFEYRPAVLLKEGDRLDNPLGFVVTAYRSDPEINRPGRAPAAGPDAVTTPTPSTQDSSKGDPQ